MLRFFRGGLASSGSVLPHMHVATAHHPMQYCGSFSPSHCFNLPLTAAILIEVEELRFEFQITQKVCEREMDGNSTGFVNGERCFKRCEGVPMGKVGFPFGPWKRGWGIRVVGGSAKTRKMLQRNGKATNAGSLPSRRFWSSPQAVFRPKNFEQIPERGTFHNSTNESGERFSTDRYLGWALPTVTKAIISRQIPS
jgi:hypothetical protein